MFDLDAGIILDGGFKWEDGGKDAHDCELLPVSVWSVLFDWFLAVTNECGKY
jgi:hypothetical protein